jgi:hypothetical protein
LKKPDHKPLNSHRGLSNGKKYINTKTQGKQQVSTIIQKYNIGINLGKNFKETSSNISSSNLTQREIRQLSSRRDYKAGNRNSGFNPGLI